MDLVHQDLEAPIHDLVDFLGVELLGDGGVIGHVGKEDGHELPFALDGAAGGEDLLGQEFGGVGLGLGVVDGRGFFGLAQVMAAFLAEAATWENLRTTI